MHYINRLNKVIQATNARTMIMPLDRPILRDGYKQLDLDVYIRAVAFERAYDLELAQVYSSETFDFLPRPLVCKERIPKALAMPLRFLVQSMFPALVLIVVYFLYQLLNSLIKGLWWNNPRVSPGAVVYLDTSSDETLVEAGLKFDIYLAPNEDLDTSAERFLRLRDYAVLTFGFFRTLASIDRKQEHWLYLHSYFKFAVVAIALQNLAPRTVIFSNQYDRWAVLGSSFKSSTLVQHGTVFIAEDRYIDLSEKLADAKLEVETLYYYEDGADDAFRCYINFGAAVRFNRKEAIKTRHETDKTQIVIVGGSDSPEFFENLVEALYNAIDSKRVELVYKVHPRSRAATKKIERHARIERSIIDCDIYISYRSTLDTHYADSETVKIIYDWQTRAIEKIVQRAISNV